MQNENQQENFMKETLQSFYFLEPCSKFNFTIGKHQIESIFIEERKKHAKKSNSNSSLLYNIQSENKHKLMSIKYLELEEIDDKERTNCEIFDFFTHYCSSFFNFYYIGILNGIIIHIGYYGDVMEKINDLPETILLNKFANIFCRPIHSDHSSL